MGKRSAVVELFLGDMGSMQRELRPSTQREDQLTMETKLEQIAVKAANQLPKSVVREIRTPRSVGTGGGRPPPVTRWARRNPRPYRDRCDYWFDHARRIKVFLLLTAWRMALRARATPGGYQDCKRRRRARRKDGLRLLVRQQSLVQSIASQSFDVLVSERTGRPS